ncbi:unnamed protein product [Kuraishia capsulata CBS 1993]|uniref:4-hydroxy-3-methoxy-5-polyprenylbenzoate decarboxylase n=1 Tax=Kuraishia capsulata CBS 1993 TaxID=1382522 RepID=W6MJI7_9ASCO|nr:uncharacterized protein KUCA_T00000573001 [Kuraishia capsulata CBS 1993]CDK24607.1 unnamed protein product [Kuraishia capsulata CBS 1993]
MLPVTAKREIVSWAVPAVLGGITNRFLGRDISLADQMEKGEVHMPNRKPAKAHQFRFKRPPQNYPEHVPLYAFEKVALFLGSSVGAFLHPERNEFIVALGESTAFDFVLKNLRSQMLSDPTGREILRERPRMTSESLDLAYLRSLPESTLGRNYVMWLDREHVSPDTREQVRYIDDEELSYVYQRYRECHDFYHTITGLPVFREGEIALKLFEFMNLQIPMTGLGAMFAPIPIKSSQRDRLFSIYYPWALKNGSQSKPLINVYWEKLLEKDIDELKAELNIERPPDMRELRRLQRQKK